MTPLAGNWGQGESKATPLRPITSTDIEFETIKSIIAK